MSSIVNSVCRGFFKDSVHFQAKLHKKGARRRVWWHPKLFRGKGSKAYGGGTVMKMGENGWERDENKIRNFVVPSIEEALSSGLQPYIEALCPAVPVKKITKWDYLKLMEETWNEENKKKFEMYKEMNLGQKAGKYKHWGS